MQDRRSVARNTGLILLAFVATLILLAGLVLVVRGVGPTSSGEVTLAPSGGPSESASRLAGFAGPTGVGKPGAGHAERG